MAKPTIRDVAQLAGVSVSVVSNALNDRGRVNLETSQRIKEAARSLGYVPNYSARRLRGEGGAIGVIINDTLEDVPLERFTGEALYWFYHFAYAQGYKLHRVQLPSTEFSEARLFDVLNDGVMDGVIFLTPRLPQVEGIVRVMARLDHLPYIFFSTAVDLPEVSYIDSDGVSGAAEVVRRLVARGHTRIGYMMPSDGHELSNAVDRLRGARDELEKAGLGFSVYYAPRWRDAIILDEILANKITALITWNDLFALRIIGDLERMGHRVPEDIAVVGFDDEMFSKWTYPKITTVSQPIAEMSKAAVDTVIQRIKTGEATIVRQKFPVQLIVRESG